jgi:hypothetical protein
MSALLQHDDSIVPRRIDEHNYDLSTIRKLVPVPQDGDEPLDDSRYDGPLDFGGGYEEYDGGRKKKHAASRKKTAALQDANVKHHHPRIVVLRQLYAGLAIARAAAGARCYFAACRVPVGTRVAMVECLSCPRAQGMGCRLLCGECDRLCHSQHHGHQRRLIANPGNGVNLPLGRTLSNNEFISLCERTVSVMLNRLI